MTEQQEQLGQWFTPVWAAEALVERYFKLGAGDLVIEPTCGEGAFLRVVPAAAAAYGIEPDPAVAARARELSGRPVRVGDFRTVPLQLHPTAIIGNPPFQAEVIDGILKRCFELLPWEGTAGFILPAYLLQTPSSVSRYAARWWMQAELLPRTLFPGLSKPLLFVLFRKSERRALVGFALYEEARDVEQMPAKYRELLRSGRGSVWRQVVDAALQELAGEASLEAIYAVIEPKRPTGNPYWREQVRKVLQQGYLRTDRGRYALAEAA